MKIIKIYSCCECTHTITASNGHDYECIYCSKLLRFSNPLSTSRIRQRDQFKPACPLKKHEQNS
jgi:hypothetical protein